MTSSSGAVIPSASATASATGPIKLRPSFPGMVAFPFAPGIAQLYAGPAQSGPGNVFSDVQTFSIPDTLRSAALSSVTFTSYSVVPGLFTTSTTGLISGFVVWPQFKVANANGDTLARKSQATNRDHGGYLFGSQPVGTRRQHERDGLPGRLDGDVLHLRGLHVHGGQPQRAPATEPGVQAVRSCIVSWVSPTGDTIRYRALHRQDDTRLKPGDRFLVERGQLHESAGDLSRSRTRPARRYSSRHRHNLATSVASWTTRGACTGT